MKSPRTYRVLVCGGPSRSREEVVQALTAQGHEITCWPPGEPFPEGLASQHLIVVDGSTENGLDVCRRFRERPGENYVPILHVAADRSPSARLAALEAGADVSLPRPYYPEELLAQAQALFRIKDSNDRLAERAAEVVRVNKRLQQTYEQIDQELELAHKIQVSFLPQQLPQVPQARFAVHYLLHGQVGGDFYDVFRLDENHVGLYVADAMGKGVPASLLTIFVKKGVRAKEVHGRDYRLVPPAEVLSRLNRDLINQALSETTFITMVYALFNHRDGTLRFSRAGHPYPLHIPRQGEPELWDAEGLLLGVFDTQFSERVCRIAPGDKVLFYSDGVDNARFENHDLGIASLIGCAARYRDEPIEELLSHMARELFREMKHPDDLTLLGLEMLEGNEGR